MLIPQNMHTHDTQVLIIINKCNYHMIPLIHYGDDPFVQERNVKKSHFTQNTHQKAHKSYLCIRTDSTVFCFYGSFILSILER